MNSKVTIKINGEDAKKVSQNGSVLFKKASYNPSPLESKVGIASEYDVVNKHLVKKQHGSRPKKSVVHSPGANSSVGASIAGAHSKPSSQHHHGHEPSMQSTLGVPSNVDKDDMMKAAKKLEHRSFVTKPKPKTSLIILKDHHHVEHALEKQLEKDDDLDDEIELLQTVMEHDDESTNLSGPPSWEKFMASELGMDPDLLKKHARHIKKKVHMDRTMMEDLKVVHPGDHKRHMAFIEEVVAAYHMKELTSRYGSKGKSPKQYFMEAYDTDTRAEMIVDDDTDAKAPFHKYDSKGKEIVESIKRSDKGHEAQEEMESAFGSPIAIRSIEAIEEDYASVGIRGSVSSDLSEPNFWKSLERIEEENTDNLNSLSDILSTCPSSKSSTLKASETVKEMDTEMLAESEMLSDSEMQSTDEDPILDKFIEPTVQEVLQSEFVRRACESFKHQLELYNAEDPLAYDLYGKTYEEVRDFTKLPEEDVAEFEAGNWEPSLFQEDEIFKMEPQEKLISRFHIYQKALLNMAEHFETLRPLLAEIKQAYEEVLEKCEKEWKDLDKDRMEKLKLGESYAEYVRQTDKDGNRAGMEVKVQAHALQEHVQWQQHTLFSIMGMLWKMRQSLKMQTRLVKKTKVIYKSKVETLARDIVSQQGQSMYESALPGKYTEIMDRFKQIKDPKEVRRMLQSARRQLRKAHKQLVVFEADYADTVPRTEFEMYKKKYTTLNNKNKSVIQRCDELKAEIEQKKSHIAKMKSQMYEEVGIDEMTGEKPIIYLEPLGINESVPIYLRYGERIVDLKYSSEEAGALIKDIWKLRVDLLNLCRRVKKAHEDEDELMINYPDDLQYDIPVIASFPDFVAEYFKNKCDLEESSMEFSYNLVAACRRNQDDSELTQFLGILEGNVNESVYHLFQLEVIRIEELLTSKSNERKENKSSLKFGEFNKLLQESLPNKTDEEFKELVKVAQFVSGVGGDADVVAIVTFFEKSETNMSDNDFVKLLRTQFEKERKSYVHEIHVELLLELGISEKLLEHIDDPAWLTDVSMHIFYAAVTSADPEITSEGLANYLAWVYLGVNALPGIVTLGTKLVEFLKERAHMVDYGQKKYDEDEDIEFEDCIRQLKEYDEDGSTLDKLDLKKRRIRTTQIKFASLRQVTDRLNSGPFVRYGKRPLGNAMAMNTEYSQVLSEMELEEVPLHQGHHRHHENEEEHEHHHHRRHNKKSMNNKKKSKFNEESKL